MEIAYDVWPHLHEKLGSIPFYERTGHLLLMESTEHRAQAKARGRMQSKLGIDTRLVEAEELREMEPGLSPKILAALFCPKDGVADHAATTRAYCVAAKKLGARLDEHCAVTSFALEGGRIQSVTTQNEEQLSVRRGVFLLSNSAVAEQVRQLTGDELPVWNACLQVLVSEPLSRVPLRHLIGHMGRTVSLKKEGDDRLMISGGWPGHWDESIPDRPNRALLGEWQCRRNRGGLSGACRYGGCRGRRQSSGSDECRRHPDHRSSPRYRQSVVHYRLLRPRLGDCAGDREPARGLGCHWGSFTAARTIQSESFFSELISSGSSR